MERESFAATIDALKRQKPFRPFIISLLNGDRSEVDFSDAPMHRGKLAVYLGLNGVPIVFDHESISEITADLKEIHS